MAKEINKDNLTTTWREYQKGLEYLRQINLFERTEKSHNFVMGDQWEGLEFGIEKPAQLNILYPIMKQATALVGQNTMTINYSSMNYGEEREAMVGICEKLNLFASRNWEKMKLDQRVWDVLQDGYIGGDAFIYFYEDDGEIKEEIIDTTQIILGDEQNQNIQEQPYILFVQRKLVEEVKRIARNNGKTEEDIMMIVADDEKESEINGEDEPHDNNKVTLITRFWKEDGAIHISRSTMLVEVMPDTAIKNSVEITETIVTKSGEEIIEKKNSVEMKLYPIAKYTWKPKKGWARGMGDIWDKIPNQISVNKNLYRFDSAVKANAFPHKIYNARAISAADIEKLNYPDSNIGINDASGQSVSNLVTYLQPASISPYAKDIWQEVMVMTRELSGAGDNLENINPERASGAAINAARDAKLLNVNAQVGAFKQFIEDISLIWYDMWVAYNPEGIKFVDSEGVEIVIEPDMLKELKVDVRIDVSPNNPYSKLAQEQTLQDLLAAGYITFEEYVKASDDNGNVPKGKLTEIIDERQASEDAALQQVVAQISQIYPDAAQALIQAAPNLFGVEQQAAPPIQ